MKKFLVLLLLVLCVGAAGFVSARQELQTPYSAAPANYILEIPHGVGARQVVGLLEDGKVIRNRYVALGYIWFSGFRHKLQAGEYLFDRPLTPVEVITRIVKGNVYLHKFTVPEGLTLGETAEKWKAQGFGTAEDFTNAARESASLVRDLDPESASVEGYLFPETYSFPRRTPAKQAIDAMVARFKSVLQQVEKEVPREAWPLGVRETVILASLIESEAAHADERPVVASVYLNRLTRRILLQCDPTVIYALELEGRYKGRLTLADLKFPSPYNTYVTPGLPPGPIMNPGYASLRAAVQPAASKYIFFVRTVDGKHTFSETLAAHNRAVAAYRLLQRKKS